MAAQKKFLLDSCVLISYFNLTDTCHKQAVRIIKDIVREKGTLFIHVLAFIECIQILKMRASVEILELFEETVLNRRAISLIRAFHLPAETSLTRTLFHQKNNLSLVDTAQLDYAINQDMKLITFDKELEKVYKQHST